MRISRVFHSGGPFGFLGGMGGLLAASLLYVQSCGPSETEVSRGHVSLVVLVPLAMFIAGGLLGARRRWRAGIAAALVAAATTVAFGLTGAIATGRVDGSALGLAYFWPVAVALLVFGITVARADRAIDVDAQRPIDRLVVWRASMLATLGMASLTGLLVVCGHALLDATFARGACVAALVAFGVTVRLALERRRRMVAAGASLGTVVPPPGDDARGYRDGGLDALISHRVSAAQSAADDSLTGTLFLAGLMTAMAVAGLVSAPAPPPRTEAHGAVSSAIGGGC